MKRLVTSFALLAVSAGTASADPFHIFTPLANNVPAGSLPESSPLQLANSSWQQRTISDRTTQLNAGQFNSGNWDMNTVNENGPDAGRYLFTVFETAQAGIQRIDLTDNSAVTIFQSPAAAPALTSHVAFDASFWTPWGTYLTAEESWRGSTGANSIYGRMFEITNPLAAPASVNLVHRDIIPRVSHEGLAFDADNNFYYIDELNGGSIYKYVSDTPTNGATYWDAGVNHVLQVGDGNTNNATGAFNWVAFTDNAGNALAGGIDYTDPNGVTSVDGRFTTDLAAYKGTNYQRPEDLQVQTLTNGDQILYFAATTTDNVYSINLATSQVSVLADSSTIDAATGLAVGGVFNNADNLAIDSEGNIYIIEDQPGGSADIWFATDANRDGVAESVSRWASLSTLGAEPTGLYFDPFNKNRAWVNVQHPSSGVDRTIEITAVPEPSSLVLAGMAAFGAIVMARRRQAR